MTGAGFAIDVLAFSLQIACVIVVAEVLARVVRVDAPSVRYQYWRTLLVFCLVLPWLQRRQVVTGSAGAIVTIPFPSTAATLAPQLGVATRVPGLSWIEIALWIVLAGIVFRLARMAFGIVRLRRFRQSGRLAPATADQEELQRALGARAEIRYVREGQPVTCGVWRPVVLLPEHLTSHPPEIQRAVLAHELLHVQRRDWLWVMGEEVVRAVFWFHPGIWWLVARVRLAREETVDDLTVRATNQRRAYVEALLAFADAAPFVPTAAFGRRRHLFRRMTLISKEAVMSSRRIVVSCAALMVGVVAGSWYAVDAFPMRQAPGAIVPAAPASASEQGPLERNAKAITPENPIPRRTYSVSPRNPGDAKAALTAVTLRVTLNALGRIGEARPLSRPLGGNGNATASDLFVKAALDAVKQWVYEPPASAPISFDVTFVFPPASETRLIAHGGPLVEGGPLGGSPGGVIGGAAPPPPPPPPPPPWVREGVTIGSPVRIGGEIKPPIKKKDVRAVYPPIAQSSHLQGVVILEVVVGTEGRVDQARVLRSIPLLDQAAIDAVTQWEFEPVLLNGVAVPVLFVVTVNFSLQ